MAKKITIDIEVNGKMQKATVSAKKLRSALDGVDNATDRTTDGTRTLDRNLKGAAKTTSNSTKEFSKMAQGMGGLVGAYATVAASVFALSAAFQFFKQAADLSALTAGQEMFAARTGVSLKLLSSNVQAATGGLVAFKEAAQAVAIGQAAGLTADQMERLGKVAKNAGTILGRDVTDAFNRLTRGAIKAEPELLDELGIIIRLDRASRDYAAAINKNVKDLTQFEKTQAVVNAVLEQGEQKFQDVGDSVNAVTQFGAAFQDTFKDLAKPIADIANFIAGALKDSIFAVAAVIGILGVNIIKSFAPVGPMIQTTAAAGIGARKRLMAAAQTETKSVIAGEIRKGQFTERQLKQIERSVRAKTSEVINLSHMERAEIERDIAIIRAQNVRMSAEGKGLMGKMFASWKINLIDFQFQYGKVMGTLKLMTAAVGAAVNKLIGAATLAGLVVMAVELGKEFRRAFLISKDLADAERATENLSSAFKKQSEAVREVRNDFEKTDNKLLQLGRSLNLVGNFNFSPVINQINSLRIAVEKLALAEQKRFSGPSATNPNDMTAALEDRSLLSPLESAGVALGVKGPQTSANTVAELNNEIVQAGKAVADLNTEFAELTRGMNPLEKARDRTLDPLRAKILQAKDNLEDLIRVADNNQLSFVKDSPEALVALERLNGLEASLPLMREAIQAISETSLVSETSLEDLDALQEQVNQARAAFDGLDPQDAIDRTRALGDSFSEATADIQTSQEEIARLAQSYGAISKAVQAFGEASGKFMPDGSQFTGIFTALDEMDNNLGNLLDKLPQLSQQVGKGPFSSGRTITIGELMGDDINKGQTAALRDAYSLIEDTVEKKFEDLTVEELRAALAERRTAIEEKYKTLEEEGFQNQKKRVGVMENALNFEKASLSAAQAAEDANLNLRKIKADIALADELGLTLADETYRQLKLQEGVAEAINKQKQEEERIQKLLLPLVKEIELLQRDDRKLRLQQSFTKEIQKQVRLQKDIQDSILDQADKDLAFKIKEAGVRNPFFNEERASAKFRLELENRTIEQKRLLIEQEFKLRRDMIVQENNLLVLKAQVAAKEAQAKAKEIRARSRQDAETEALAAHYDSIANLQLSFIPQYRESAKLATALANQLEKASKADLTRFRDELRLAVEELEPLNLVLNDAADAFGKGLNDGINAVFQSLYDESMKLSDALKDVARGVLRTIQESIVKNIIVDPLLEKLGLQENQAEAMKQAIIDAETELAKRRQDAQNTANEATKQAGTDVANDIQTKIETGGNHVALKIQEAIRDIELRIKVDCCDSTAALQPKPDTVPGPVAVPPATSQPSMFDPYTTPDTVLPPLAPTAPGAALPAPVGMAPPPLGAAGPTVELGPTTLATLKAPGGAVGSAGMGQDPFGPTGTIDGITYESGAPPEGMAGGAKDPKVTATEENTSKLGEMQEVLGENVFAIGGSIAALMGNSSAAQKLQKAMAVLHLAMMIQRLITKLQTKSEVANTVVEKANTAAVATLTKVMIAKPAAKGLYPPLGYGDGGIARGPKAGYPAILHGDEAVVPLPDGKKIPVDLNVPNRGQMGESSQQNNVTVNLSIEGGRTERNQDADSEEARQLGVAISAAVQKELVNQKRPGGILSPHGVS
tara:strand:+ start:442 stop:5331 length:4890 start_codon:yes stop_codon:yes gene_type:complete